MFIQWNDFKKFPDLKDKLFQVEILPLTLSYPGSEWKKCLVKTCLKVIKKSKTIKNDHNSSKLFFIKLSLVYSLGVYGSSEQYFKLEIYLQTSDWFSFWNLKCSGRFFQSILLGHGKILISSTI